MSPIRPICYVAMSGGVDSSVAAALLAKKYHITGVFFKPWQPNGFYCNWQQDRLDAMRAAAKIGIPFKTWDFSCQYKSEVAQYMIEAYRHGITPNPDVMCNKEIKFGLFMKKAIAEGADYIATGHYARVRENPKSKFQMLKAKDQNKDQTYFLWTLTQEQLKHVLFPIGDYTKPEVRKLAKKIGLPNHAKKDSQGVCFIGQLDMHDFLTEYIKPLKGDIVCGGKIIGQHDGVSYYTIGQRHGLDIKDGGGPYYVARKNIEKNILYVSKFLMTNDEFRINDINLIKQIKLPKNISVQIRYRSPKIPAFLSIRHSSFVIRTSRPAAAVTPGQSAVFYAGQEVLGGGIVQ